MALVAHYKLDGNANDSSGYENDGSPSGVSWTNGKISQAAQMDSGSITFPDSIGYNYSFSFWVKLKSDHTGSYRKFLQRGSNRSPGFWFHSTSNRLTLRQETETVSNLVADTGSELTLNKWHHVVLTCRATDSQTIITSYLDGSQENSTTENSAPVITGSGISLLSTDYDIDDLRIYDHPISLKQVRELSRAKFLHYKFDDFQEPTENVVTNTDLDTGWSKNYTQNILWNDISPPTGVDSPVVSFENDDTGGEGYWFSYGDYAPQADNTTYTVSVWAKTNQASDVSIEFYTADNDETDRYSSELQTVNSSEGWKRIVWDSFTTANPTDSDSLSFQYFNLYDGGYTRLWLCAPQMEAKPYATPFTTGTRTGTVMDCSSQDNHTDLELDYTPQWVIDSKLGQGCYHLDGTGTIDGTVQGSNIKVDESLTNTNNYSEGCTYSFWINVDTGAADRMSLLWGGSTIRHIEIYSSGKNFRTEAATENGYSFGSGSFPDDVRGQWAHFAIVFANEETNRPVRWYQNGTLFHTGSMDSGINPGGEYFSFSSIGRATGSTSYTYAPSFDGKIDDFRIYGTALSDSDIKELAKTRASLDDEGSFHALGVNETKHSPLILDYTIWEDGQTGSVGDFGDYSNGNSRIISRDPFGKETVVWKSSTQVPSDATYPSQGGIYHSYVPIDNTKMYRLSWWENRVTNNGATYGRYYAGCNGGGGGDVLNRDNGSVNTNPYFSWWNHGSFTEGEWLLVVGHVWPAGSGAGSDHPDSRVYRLDGSQFTPTDDYVFESTTTTLRSRTLSLYRGDVSGMVHHTVYPRMDVVDGTEPSIAELLAGHDSRNIERIRAKGGTSNLSMGVGDRATDLGTISELGPTAGLVAYYPLDGDAKDYSGGYDATSSNIVYTSGIKQTARASGYATVPADSGFNVKGDMTLSFWFKPSADGARRVVIQTAFAGSFCINHETAGDLRFYNGDDSNYDSLDSSTLTNGQWYHCVAVRKGSTRYWYLNGSLDVSDTTSYNGGSLIVPLVIGSGYTGKDAAGLLDEVRIYNRALSSEEISILYSMTGPGDTKMKQSQNNLYLRGNLIETY